MNLWERFELLDQVSEWDPSRDCTYRARQLPAGRVVALHLLPGGMAPDNVALLQQAERALATYGQAVLEHGEWYGLLYVVTEVLPASPTLRQWVASLPPPPAAPPAGEAGQMSRVGVWRVPQFEAQPAQAPPPLPPEEIPTVQMPLPSPPASEPAQQLTAAPPPVSNEPGEFTRLMQAQSAPPSPQPTQQMPAAPPPAPTG